MLKSVEIIAHVHLVAGVLLNCALLYAIRRFTKKSLGTYKQLLTLFAAFDIFLTLLHAVVKPQAVVIDATLGVVSAFDSRKITCFACTCSTVPHSLLIIHFLYRFWSIRYPHLIPLFSKYKFISCLFCNVAGVMVVWYFLCFYGMSSDGIGIGKTILNEEYERRFGIKPKDSWILLHFDETFELYPRAVFTMVAFDVLICIALGIAILLAGATFYHIKRADKLSAQANALQLKLFIAVCAQTCVPLILVNIPNFCCISFPFFRLPIFYIDDACMLLTSCFPAYDAIVIIVLMRDYRTGMLGLVRKVQPALPTVFMTTTTMNPSTVSTVGPYQGESGR